MGMYTGVRGTVTFKSMEFAENLEYFLSDEDCWEPWREMSLLFPEFKGLKGYSKEPRASFIPCGAVCYLDWGDQFVEFNGKEMTFQCSLKNYEDEIGTFIRDVLPEVAEDWDLEVQYEEWVDPIKASKSYGYFPKRDAVYDFDEELGNGFY